MPVITIRGQEASGAPEIGTMVAKELKIDYVDSRIIADVAARLNRQELEVLKRNHRRALFLAALPERWLRAGARFPTIPDPVMGSHFICRWKSIRGKYRSTTNFICKL